MTTEPKLEFGTPAWIEALGEELTDCLADADDEGMSITFAFSERFEGVPAVVSRQEVGWTARIVAGDLSFVPSPSDDVDLAIAVDYAAGKRLSTYVVGGDPARQVEYDHMVQAEIDAGRVRVRGNLSAIPAAFAGLHDRIAARTT